MTLLCTTWLDMQVISACPTLLDIFNTLTINESAFSVSMSLNYAFNSIVVNFNS